MNSQDADYAGRFANKGQSRPTAEVDCSNWDADDSAVQWTTGHFEKKAVVRPVVEGDCSRWPDWS